MIWDLILKVKWFLQPDFNIKFLKNKIKWTTNIDSFGALGTGEGNLGKDLFLSIPYL